MPVNITLTPEQLATIEDASLLADIYFKADELYKTKKIIPRTEAILEILRAPVIEPPIDWKKVKEGTPVLFRRSKEDDYEAGTRAGGYAYRGATAGAFGWAMAAGRVPKAIGARVAENDEWHIDPYYCKLAEKD
jgi:hypothetical protein